MRIISLFIQESVYSILTDPRAEIGPHYRQNPKSKSKPPILGSYGLRVY